MLLSLRKIWGDKRSSLQVKNIFSSFVYKIIGLGCTFLMVSLLFSQLTEDEYGIFVTIISITSWFTFLDLGLGNGLKNKLSEALANNNPVLARTFTSTAYLAMAAVVAIIVIIFLGLFPFVPFGKIILGSAAASPHVDVLVKWALCLFCIRMVGDLMNAVLLAVQKAALSALLQMIVQLIVLAIFMLLKLVYNNTNLLTYGLVYFITPLVVTIVAHFILFSGALHALKPSIKYYNRQTLHSLFSIGLQFLVIQLAVLVVFTTDNLIIGRLLGYEHVASYNIAFRYFSILTFGWMIIVSTLWPAFSEAFAKKDMIWIQNTVSKVEKLWLLLALAAIVMLLVSKWVYKIWINESTIVSYTLSFAMMIFVLVNAITNLYVYFLNGINKIRWQVYLSIIAAIINIPLCILFAKIINLGNTGVIIGSTLSILPSLIYSKILTNKLLYNK